MKNMGSLKERLIAKKYSGLIGITAFLVWVLITEIGSSIIGRDLGSFLYVTFHFGVNPVMALVVIIWAIFHSIRAKETFVKALDLFACIIPAFIIYTGITGSLWLSQTAPD